MKFLKVCLGPSSQLHDSSEAVIQGHKQQERKILCDLVA